MTKVNSAGSLATDTMIAKPISENSLVLNENISRHKRKPGNLGVTLIALGVICCISGFILMFNSDFGSLQFNISLYGLTSAGGSSIMGGLFLLLG